MVGWSRRVGRGEQGLWLWGKEDAVWMAMKKILWSDDEGIIRREIDILVQEKTALVCGRRGLKNVLRIPVVAKTAATTGGVILVLHHPHEPSCKSGSCMFYYHRPGNPLRYFECVRVKKAGDYVGYELPRQIYYIHRREHDRVATPQSSTVTFSLQQKQRIHNGTMDDISIQGAKVSVNMPLELAAGTTLCHITLTLCLRASLLQTVIFVPEAVTTWSKCANSVTSLLGIKFILSGNELAALQNYIDLRLIEDADVMGEGIQGDANPAAPTTNPFMAADGDDDDLPLF
jgi:hypothetical protein